MNVHAVLKLHYALQLVVTLVTEISFIQMLMHMHCLPGHNLTYLLLAMHILQCWINSSKLLKDLRQSLQLYIDIWWLCWA